MSCLPLRNSPQIPVKPLRLKHWKKNHVSLKTDYEPSFNKIKEKITKLRLLVAHSINLIQTYM